MLRSVEQKLESLFEGVFGRAFRTNVQPVELARKLQKEIDDPQKRVRLARVRPERVLALPLPEEAGAVRRLRGLARRRAPGLPRRARAPGELRAPVRASRRAPHGRRPRRRRVRDRSPPRPTGEAHPDTAARRARRPEPSQATRWSTSLASSRRPTEASGPRPSSRSRSRSASPSTWEGQRLTVEKRRVVIGRSRECDVQLSDPNVSRRHAELRQEGASYWIVDLDSTNGIEVNGRKLKRWKHEDRRPRHTRLDGDRLKPGAGRMILADSVSVDELLLILKVAFLVLLYLFIWRIVRTASRELTTTGGGRAVANESMVLAPGQASALGLARRGSGEVVVVRSTRRCVRASASRSTPRRRPSAAPGRTTSSSAATSSPRRNTPASSRARADVWVEDDGSTNGTYVNGHRIEAPAERLAPGGRRADGRDRAAVRGRVMGLGHHTAVSDTGRKRRHQRGFVRRAAAALRGRRRDGRGRRRARSPRASRWRR